MDDLRGASITHYNTGSRREQELAKKVFKAMDADGDGLISVAEFSNYVSKLKLKGFNENFFKQIDKDHNGFLDFDEALLFYYIATTRPSCDMCGERILGMYYSCVKCFRKARNSGYLCPSCHSRGTFKHKHKHEEFVDNFVLLWKQNPSTSNAAASFGLGMDLGGLAAEVANGCAQM